MKIVPMKLSEKFLIGAIINKLPPSWNDYKRRLSIISSNAILGLKMVLGVEIKKDDMYESKIKVNLLHYHKKDTYSNKEKKFKMKDFLHRQNTIHVISMAIILETVVFERSK